MTFVNILKKHMYWELHSFFAKIWLHVPTSEIYHHVLIDKQRKNTVYSKKYSSVFLQTHMNFLSDIPFLFHKV